MKAFDLVVQKAKIVLKYGAIIGAVLTAISVFIEELEKTKKDEIVK